MEDGGLKKRQTKVNVVRGTPEGQTCEKKRRTRPECNNGIRGRGARQHLHLEKEKMHHKAARQSLRLEIARLIFESSIRIQELGTGYCGSVGPHRSRRGSAIAAPWGAAAKDNGGGRGSGRESHGGSD
jgi:hypothetical protein